MICSKGCHLIFPERMFEVGRKLRDAHGILEEALGTLQFRALDLGEGTGKLQHRCQRLTVEGECGIYDTRLEICRAFRCAQHAERFPENEG
jgi:Fe-S-cluster containining protein